jgi:putative selenate reductase
MAELVPLPLGRLVSRMFKELERGERESAIFDLPRAKFFRGLPGRDLSVRFHGHVASTPLGPAAGPHSQLAQNIVLAFLAGARVFELKTVQVMDELQIPRPCIDATTVGYNVEWSQELKLEQSLDEYVKASMLIEMLAESDAGKALGLSRAEARVVFDMSVGYDLAGIGGERVRAFIAGMKDCSAVVERLRKEIPAEHARFRDLDFTTKLSDTLTLSTFHGCPPEEIERIVDHLLRVHGLHTIVKLNPTLLGPVEARRIFNERLGYAEQIPDEAFEKDAKWSQAVDFVGRLGDTAASLGRSFGVKFSNTLIVGNHKEFFPPSEKVMYLSGPPLHVLAMSLVARFRETFGDGFPISFSAGIDKGNFADAVSLGLVPVTVCTDLLRPGGYGRASYYFADLGKRMAAAGARDVEEWIVRGQGQAAAALQALSEAELEPARRTACVAAIEGKGELRAAAGHAFERWLSEAKLRNTKAYVGRLLDDPRYANAANAKAPPKVGSKLWMFECLTCDKCVPVCPNDANFTFEMPTTEIPVVKLMAPTHGGPIERDVGEPIRLQKKHQIANFADFCNECGNCDVFCPEDGGPYVLKPRFFSTEETFARFSTHDGFFVARDRVLARFQGKAYRVDVDAVTGPGGGEGVKFTGPGFEVKMLALDPEGSIEGRIDPGACVDLAYFRIMDGVRKGVMDGPGVNYVNT